MYKGIQEDEQLNRRLASTTDIHSPSSKRTKRKLADQNSVDLQESLIKGSLISEKDLNASQNDMQEHYIPGEPGSGMSVILYKPLHANVNKT